jgi:hypothetical protein
MKDAARHVTAAPSDFRLPRWAQISTQNMASEHCGKSRTREVTWRGWTEASSEYLEFLSGAAFTPFGRSRYAT